MKKIKLIEDISDKIWNKLNKGMPYSEQCKYALSYNHCSICGNKIDYHDYRIDELKDEVICEFCE